MERARVVFLVLSILALIASTLTLALCAYYKDRQFNTLTCEIFGVTEPDSVYTGTKISWFIQYNYRGINCTDYDTYTIYASDYEESLGDYDSFINVTSKTCYAKKSADQCDVSMKDTEDSGFVLGIILGSVGTFASLVSAIYQLVHK